MSRLEWQPDSVQGVSGLEVTNQGNSFLAISDMGWRIEGQFERDDDGVIVGAKADAIEPIIGMDGWPVSARRVGDLSDAEGLAIAPDGKIWMSFERYARVWRYDAIDGEAHHIFDHPTFITLKQNRQLEAMAVDPDGNAYVFTETPLADGFPVYLLVDDRWTIDRFVPQRDGFSIVGADFAPDGRLYLLERKLVVGLWWQSRIRRLDLSGDEDVSLWTSSRGEYDNLEGISVWSDGEALRLTLVSDNNRDEDEPTEFVEFRLTD